MADKEQSEGKPQSSDTKKEAKETSAQGESTSQSAANAIELLKADHREVEKMFSAFESATKRAEKEKIARKVCQSLIIHTVIEEEIFYPACKEHVEDDDLDEAQVEHDSAKFLIQDILSQSPEAPFYDAKVSVLAEQIKHHVAEEEKRAEGIFAQAKAGGVDTEDLARRLQARKSELMQLAEQDDLPRQRTRSIRAQFKNESEERTMPNYRDRERDDYGRFASDDDDRRSYRSQQRGQGGRYREDDDDDRRSYRSRGMPERDENGRFMSHDDDYRRGQGMRSNQGQGRRYEDDDDNRGRAGRRSGGWFGDPEGHSQASRAGWRNSDHEGSGWYGDYEGHSEASRRGWEGRSASGNRSSRYREDDEGGQYGRSRAASSGGRQRYEEDDEDDRRRSGRGQGGWFGDSEGHSEASRRGWDNRR